MKILIDTTKSIEENATRYYDKSKKSKRKFEGLKKAIEVSKKKIEKIDKKVKGEKKKFDKPEEKKWFMKFRWFHSSNGFLCVGGRDAQTNEILIKKHTDAGDLVFHTEMPGSPFFVVKALGKKVPKKTQEEAAQATASFSKSWKEGFTTAEVYSIDEDQVVKEQGLSKGSFMIKGKRKYYNVKVELYIGMKDKYLECGPVPLKFKLQSGGKKTDVAKKIQKDVMDSHNIKYSIDDIVRILPPDCSLA